MVEVPAQPSVLLFRCPDYDPERIRDIVRRGIDELGLVPNGRVLVKPNVVAAGKNFPHAYTRPEFAEGVLNALRDRGSGIRELAVGERCGITMPTRYAFKGGGYFDLADRLGDVRVHCFDEVSQVGIPLRHSGRLRDRIFVPEPVARADFFVNCPKFKAHPWTTVTFSMKNYIGIQDDRHRLIDHDHLLERKVADLQYAVQPRLIAVDAIVAGEGRMLTPVPFDLGLVVIGNNQAATDAVCSRIIGVDPRTVEHLRLAEERGFGPLDLDRIRIGGDVSLDEAKERATGFRVGLVRVEEYFRGTNIAAYGGRPPGQSHDYCWGGCPGALEEAIEILRLFDRATDEKFGARPKTHIVFGRWDGPIDAAAGEKIVFIGDCAEFHGPVAGRQVDISSTYVDRSAKEPLDARHDDIYVKIGRTSVRMWKSRDEQVVRLGGCPVSVAEQVLALVSLGGIKNPYLAPDEALGFTNAYLSWRARTVLKRLLGQPYNVPEFSERGAGKPAQSEV